MSLDGDLLVSWKDSFAVGDPLIDGQHREFFDVINAMAAALDHERAREAVTGHYRAFVSHLVQHFRDEEVLMERIGYPDLDNHNAEHDALLASVAAIEDLVLSGERGELRHAIKRLFAALVEHLVTEDLRYRRFMPPVRARA